jgi:F-type H+-transporting ATPase subunit b
VLFKTSSIVIMAICLSAVACSAQEPGAQAGRAAAEAEHAGEARHDHASGGHGAHGHDIGHKGVSHAPEEFKADLAIYTFIVFLLLLGILWRFAWGPIVEGLEKREHGIAEHIAAAEKANQDARNMLAEYERKLASSADEVRAIIDEARRDAEHTQQEILAKARADAQAERDRALREIETARDQALKELGERSANLAVDLAGKIVRAQLNPADHARLIDDAMNRFPSATPSKN